MTIFVRILQYSGSFSFSVLDVQNVFEINKMYKRILYLTSPQQNFANGDHL